MKDISLDKAELIAIFPETFLYGKNSGEYQGISNSHRPPSGIFFTLFWITLSVLFKEGTETSRNRSLLALLVSMLILITAVS